MLNNLKSIREEKNLSLQDICSMCGIAKSQIHHLEKGTSSPRLDTAYKISKVLELEVTEIWPNTFIVIEETITIRKLSLAK